MYKSLFVVLAMTAFVSSARATLFDNLKSSFDKSSLPQTKDLKGHWAGRCVESTSPDEIQPAVFIFKVLEDQMEFPPYRPTFTYFWKPGVKKDLFDKMSPSQVESDIDVKAWLAKEQWQTANVKDGSIANDYSASDKIVFHRAIRTYADEFNSTTILRVVRTVNGTDELRTFCYFRQKLGGTIEDPTPSEYSVANVGPLSNDYVKFENPRPEAMLKAVNILNLGKKAITISDARFTYKGALVAYTTKAVKVFGGQLLAITAPPTLPGGFQFDTADFYVGGSTDGLRITASTGKPFNSDNLLALE